jgi:hypothetical protein
MSAQLASARGVSSSTRIVGSATAATVWSMDIIISAELTMAKMK